jgi:F0F1-type ATP synthase assembly protein I
MTGCVLSNPGKYVITRNKLAAPQKMECLNAATSLIDPTWFSTAIIIIIIIITIIMTITTTKHNNINKSTRTFYRRTEYLITIVVVIAIIIIMLMHVVRFPNLLLTLLLP